jgi:hypothetical protein
MEIEYELTAADLEAFQQYHGQKVIPPPRPRHWLWDALPWLLIVSIFLLLGVNSTSEPLRVLLILFAGMVVSGLFLFVVTVLRKRAPEKNPLNVRLRMTLTPAGVRVTTPTSSTLDRWPDIQSVGVTDDHLFLYTDSIIAHILPRRAFPNDTAFHAFVDCVYDYDDARNEARFGEIVWPAEDSGRGGAIRIDDQRTTRPG